MERWQPALPTQRIVGDPDVDGPPDTLLIPADVLLAEAAVPGSDDVFYFAYGAYV